MSKLLITSDWQLRNENLDKAKLFSEQILDYCSDHKVETIAHLGDLKHQYSPVDIQAVIFAVKLIRRCAKYGIVWYQLSGNHDRISMNDVSTNWMGVLRAAGAFTITAPTVIATPYMRLAFVPYIDDPSALTDAFKRITDSADLLLFHNTIKKCRVNVLKTLDEGVSVEDIYSGRYRYCIAGHIHLPQKIGDNIYFVGSPFCQDWGESNQQKRFLVYDSISNKLSSVDSKIPGMYDTSWPDFPRRDISWRGTSVRVHVACNNSVDITKTLLKAKTKAEKAYPKAIIIPVPEFNNKDDSVQGLTTTDDETALKEYVDSTCPEYLKKQKNKLLSYLKFKLAEKGYVRRSSQIIEFIEGEGKNFLCFKKIKIDFRHRGIIVVTGKNKDWPQRSNGTGKTSYLQLPAVAIADKTLKGQANEKWVRRNSKGQAWVKLRLRLQDKRKCLISRTRRPVKLNLIVGGKDRSTGIGSRGTQKAIETLTGLTWETLTNAIYIDQTEVNEILKGKDSERKAIFSKLLNLERFHLAKEILKDELTKVIQLKVSTSSEIEFITEEIEAYKSISKDIDYKEEYKQAKKDYVRCVRVLGRYKHGLVRYLKRQKRCVRTKQKLQDKLGPKIQDILDRVEVNIELRGAYKKELEAFESVEAICPNCRQEVSPDWRKKRMRMLTDGLKMIANKIHLLDKERKPYESKFKQVENNLYAIDNKVSRIRVKLEGLEDKVEDANKLCIKYRSKEKLHYKYIKIIKNKKQKRSSLESLNKALSMDKVFIEYGIKVFSKDGLPAYLINTLCPLLNIAARKYAKLISEDEIKVKFKIDEDGAIYPKISNAHGGEYIDDQSRGETRLASMITSFAVRDVTNPANLLILDEPGEGLDSHNAALFAEVLKEVSKRFGLIIITSHNPIILSALENEKHIHIEKKNKIARVI